MVNSNKVALGNARKQRSNEPGKCQQVTRTWFDAPSAGDRDGDGDADAKDGWLSEPISARVPGDRNPPEGAPLYFEKNGGTGFGHRCISTGINSGARSTDMSNGKYAKGKTGSATIEQIERSMGVKYIGWSRTITGIPIPGLEKKETKPTPPKKPTKPKTAPKPAPKKPKDNEVGVRMSHASMQFSDSVAQKRRDADTIFKQAAHANHWWVTGTEALEVPTRQALAAAARKYGFEIYFGTGTDVWGAVNLKAAVRGSIKGWTGPTVVRGQKGKFASKKVVRISFTNDEIGDVVVYPAHAVLGVHKDLQKQHMEAIGKDAKRQAAGSRLAFMGADTNRQDKKFDMAYGNGFVSCWDDLKEYPSTGHGTIDGIFRWKADGRVRCVNANVNDDKDLPLHTDHFQIAAFYAVKQL